MEEQLLMFLGEYGVLSVFVVILLEYACFPVSSEIVLPISGMIAAKIKTPLVLMILLSVLAGLIGSTICYLIGRFSFKVLENILKKFPKMALSLEKTCNWQRRHQKVSVMFARVIPIFRTYISFVSGMVKQNYLQFLLFSSIGIFVWNSFLIGAGFVLGESSDSVIILIERFLIFIAIIFLFAFVLKKFISYRKSKT